MSDGDVSPLVGIDDSNAERNDSVSILAGSNAITESIRHVRLFGLHVVEAVLFSTDLDPPFAFLELRVRSFGL